MIRYPARRGWMFFTAVILIFADTVSYAQTSQATLQGQVIGMATGQPVPKALVIERNLQTNSQSYRYTNEQGLYSFPALLPGTYSVRVDALGYQAEQRSPVELPVASRIELNFALNMRNVAPPPPAPLRSAASGITASNILSIMYGSDAAVPQAVIISLPTLGTDTLIGSISSLIDERKILELPLSGRDVYTLLVLQPGVTSDNATARGLGFSVNGQRVGSSNFLLDGVDNNDLLVTGPATFVSADAVKEYRMTTSNFTAEYGRASGFVANAVTRTGTNSLHGTIYEFFNHDRLNANSFIFNWQGTSRQPYRQNQYGASIGGPLRRDRLFFFGNFEQNRSSSQSQPFTVFLPSPLFISIIPSASPAKGLFANFSPPSGQVVPNTGGLVVSRQVFIPVVQQNSLALGRADYNSPNGRHHLSGRYAYSEQTTDDFFFNIYPGLNTPLVSPGQNFGANYTRDLYGGVNELKFGFSRNSVRLLRPHPELPTILSADLLLSPGLILLPGMESSFDYLVRDSVIHVVENYSRLFGRHSLVLGGEWRLGLTDSFSSPFGSGRYSFINGTELLTSILPEQLIIPINRFTGAAPSEKDFWRYYRQGDWAGFFQDNFKLTRRITLNLGLRYEYFGVPVARNSTLDSNFIFGPGQNIEQRITTASLQQTKALYDQDLNNFAPRFGVAADLTGRGKSVLRGGYGIFYDRIFNNLWLNVRNNNLPVQCIIQPPLTEKDFGCNFPSVQAPFSFSIPAAQGLSPLNPASVQNTSTVALDTKLRTPYTQNWFIGFQQQLTPNLLFEVDQVGSLGRKLTTGDGINRADSLPRTPDNPHGRLNVNFGDVLYYATEGHSNHWAIQTSLNRRWNRGVQFQISYTYARTKDVQSDPLVVPGDTLAGNPSSRLAASNLGTSPAFVRQFDPSADFGNSNFDQRHNLVLNFVAQMPRFSGWRKVAGNWQAAGIVGIRSGFPFTVVAPPSFTIGERQVSNRADFTGTNLDQAFLSTPTSITGGVQLLDPTKFKFPPAGQLGNLARNSLYGPGFWNVDFGISRTFGLRRLGEQRQLQFRAEVFNLFNHTNLNNPDPFIGFSTFGQALFGRQGFGSALPSVSPLNDQPRRVQFVVKIYF